MTTRDARVLGLLRLLARSDSTVRVSNRELCEILGLAIGANGSSSALARSLRALEAEGRISRPGVNRNRLGQYIEVI